MRLLVTGGSSFVGAHFCRMAGREHEVVALHHSTPLALNGITPLRVDLRRARDRARLAAVEADAVVHIACKIKARPTGEESPAEAAARFNGQMMDAVLSLGKPVVYASSTVVHWNQDTPSARSRREDEERLAASGLPYAILRPSAPYGPALINHKPGHRESFHTLVDLVRHAPLVPVVGNGEYRRQPIHVDDFSAAILALLALPSLPCTAHDAGGPEPLTMNEIVDGIGAALGKRPRKFHLPKALFVKMARFSRDFDPSLLAAMDEDELADPSSMVAATGVEPRPFGLGVVTLLR